MEFSQEDRRILDLALYCPSPHVKLLLNQLDSEALEAFHKTLIDCKRRGHVDFFWCMETLAKYTEDKKWPQVINDYVSEWGGMYLEVLTVKADEVIGEDREEMLDSGWFINEHNHWQL